MYLLFVYQLTIHVNYTLYFLYMQPFDICILKSCEQEAQNILNSLKAFVQVH